MAQVSQQVSVSHTPAEVESGVSLESVADVDVAATSALENVEVANVLTVTVVEQAGWTLMDLLSIGVLIMEVLVGLVVLAIPVMAFFGYNSFKEIHEESVEKKLWQFRKTELPGIIRDAIREHGEVTRQKGTAKARDKEEAAEEQD